MAEHLGIRERWEKGLGVRALEGRGTQRWVHLATPVNVKDSLCSLEECIMGRIKENHFQFPTNSQTLCGL